MSREGGDRSWILLLLAVLSLVGVSSVGASAKPASGAQAPPAGAAADSQARAASDVATATWSQRAEPTPSERQLIELLARSLPGADATGTLEGLLTSNSHTSSPVTVSPLLVMVPDPGQSHMALYFDQAVDSLLRAAARAELTRESAFLPWRGTSSAQRTSEPEPSPSSAKAASGELGAIVFRKGAELVVALLVTESPVSGARPATLEEAYRLADILGARAGLSMVGPFFSGSAPALAQSLSHWQGRPGKRSVRMITGTATAPVLPGLSDGKTPSDELRFSRTVADDGELVRFVLGALEQRGGKRRMAVLAESGTDYAKGALRELTNSGPSYWFPLHISQLRAARQAQSKPADDSQVANLRRTLTLSFDPEEERGSEAIPVLSALTRYDTELSLAQVLERICRERVEYLALVASDPADLVLVAQEARRYCPDLVLLSLGADELVLHPDLRTAFSGALVASSYPLAFQSSAWAQPEAHQPLQHFPSAIAQGFYNAALAILIEASFAPPGTALEQYDLALGQPACPAPGPRLWLSTVANGGFWPVAVGCAQSGQFYRPSPPDPTREPATPEHATLRASGLAHGTALLLFFGMLLHCLAALGGRHFASKLAFVDLFIERPGSLGVTQGRYIVATHVSLVVLALLMLPPGAYSWAHAPDAPALELGLGVGVLTGAVAGLALLFDAGRVACKTVFALRHPAAHRWHLSFVTGFALLIAVVLLLIGSGWVVHWCRLDQTQRLLAAARIVEPLGISPLAPTFYLAAGFYVWGLCGLRRVRELDRFSKGWPLPFATEANASQARDVTQPLLGIWRGSLWHFELVVLALFVLPGAYFWQRLLPSFEGAPYDTLIKAAFIVLYGAVVFAFVHFVMLWKLLSRFLKELAAQPMVSAYDRIGSKVKNSFGLQLSARVPDAEELDVSGRIAETLASLAKSAALTPDAVFRPQLQAAAPKLARAARRVRRALAQVSRRGAACAEAQRGVHDALFLMSRRLFRVLRALWKLRAHSPVPGAIAAQLEALLPGGAEERSLTAPLLFAALPQDVYLWLRVAEEFVALRVVTLIHHVFFQLRNLLTFALIAALLLVVSMASYPFHPSRFVTVFPWLLALVVILASLGLIVRMEHNEILSRLGGSSPGRIDFNLGFVTQLATYVVLPLAAILSRLFPETGDLIFSTLSPLARLLP